MPPVLGATAEGWSFHFPAYLAGEAIEQDWSDETRKVYASAFQAFLREASPNGDVGVAVARWRDDMRRRFLSENTVALRLTVVRGYFRWLHQHGHIEQDPLRYMRVPRKQLNPRPMVEDDVVGWLLEQLPDMARRPRLIFALAIYGGLRASEIRMLRVSDVHPEERELVVIGKGRKRRRIRIHPNLLAILRPELADVHECRNCAYGPDGYLLPGDKFGQPMGRGQVYREVTRYVAASPHRFRSTWVTTLLEQGVKLHIVAEQAGHSSVQTTLRHYKSRQDRAAEEAIDAVRFGG